MNTLKCIIYICFFSLAGKAFAQTKLQIISGNDHSILPYATISNLAQQLSFSANSIGEIKLNSRQGDTIEISYVGYKTAVYIYKENEERTIDLYRDITIMSGIIISNCKKTKKVSIKNVDNSKRPKGGFSGYSWSFGTSKSQFAVLIKSPQAGAFLNKFSFWLKNYAGPDSVVLAPFSITFYEVSDTGNLPLRPIIGKPIIYFPTMKEKHTIKTDTLQILIPSKGIYVCFQYIMDEKYSWEQKMGNGCAGCKDTIIRSYGAILDGTHSSNYPVALYNYLNDSWEKIPTAGSIKFEAVLSYCKE